MNNPPTSIKNTLLFYLFSVGVVICRVPRLPVRKLRQSAACTTSASLSRSAKSIQYESGSECDACSGERPGAKGSAGPMHTIRLRIVIRLRALHDGTVRAVENARRRNTAAQRRACFGPRRRRSDRRSETPTSPSSTARQTARLFESCIQLDTNASTVVIHYAVLESPMLFGLNFESENLRTTNTNTKYRQCHFRSLHL